MSSLYIHIPFCEKKCFYCSFVVSVGQEKRVDRYIECLNQEAGRYKGTVLETIFIGGGTPSSLDEGQLEKLVILIESQFTFNRGIEFTLEANPESIDYKKAKFLKGLGINRISLGVQSFNDEFLQYLGRNHGHQRAIKSFYDIREAGFHNVNIDLMHGFPSQTLEQIKDDLDQLQVLDPDHVSLYTLTIEENSRFFTKKVKLDDDILAQQYVYLMEKLEAMGFQQYEVSNFAKAGKESQHNLNYWFGGNYVGLGVGAHSHKDGRRWWNVDKLIDYIELIDRKNGAVAEQESLDNQKRLSEKMVFGLRTKQGIDLEEMQTQLDCRLDDERAKILRKFMEMGYLEYQNRRLKVTGKGLLILDEISVRLI